jgi:hypothetical protein
MLNVDPKSRLYRGVAALAGLCIFGMGLRPILSTGDLNYRNWFGGLVFSPIAMLLGAFVMLAALLRPQWLQAPREKR